MQKLLYIPDLSDKEISNFWAKVTIGTSTDCWHWVAATRPTGLGYGAFSINGRSYRAHRIAWFLYNRRRPGNLPVCHHCDNPRCCNPHHLFLGTLSDNCKDMVQKGRGVDNRGENYGQAKLSNADISQIRKLYNLGYPQYNIAKEFQIHQATVSRIVNYLRWSHL